MRRTIPGNGRVALALIFDPDRWSKQAASLGVMTNTFSPASSGPGSRYVGDPGYGVSRWAGRTTYPLQQWYGAARPVTNPQERLLGFGAGVSGQPGLPSTGQLTGGISSLTWLSYSPTGRAGLR